MTNKQTICTIFTTTIQKRTGIDIYLLDAHQKYNEPLELTKEQQHKVDEWSSEILE